LDLVILSARKSGLIIVGNHPEQEAKMRFDWFSFVLGVVGAMLILGWGQRLLNRLRWRKMSASLAQYAKNLEDAKRPPHKP